MLITFKSKAAAEVVMYEAHAKPILDLLHKDIQRGVITAAEISGALALLEQQIDSSKAREAAEARNANDGDSGEKIEPVTFAARAYPLLDMLRAAKKGNHDILWGV